MDIVLNTGSKNRDDGFEAVIERSRDDVMQKANYIRKIVQLENKEAPGMIFVTK